MTDLKPMLCPLCISDDTEQGIIWRPIVSYKGLYEVSNTGLVRSVEKQVKKKDGRIQKYPKRPVKQFANNKGYLQVSLSILGKNKPIVVHKLVADAFLPFDIEKDQINHIDGNKLNNNLSNLERCTRSENMNHAYKVGLKKRVRRHRKLKDHHIEQIQKLLNPRNKSYEEIGKMFGVTGTHISRIHRGIR